MSVKPFQVELCDPTLQPTRNRIIATAYVQYLVRYPWGPHRSVTEHAEDFFYQAFRYGFCQWHESGLIYDTAEGEQFFLKERWRIIKAQFALVRYQSPDASP